MNAKKIMGAVLVALLAAALFVGAGAADATDLGTLYTYSELPEALQDGGLEFSSDAGTIVVVTNGGNFYFAVNDVKAGVVYSGADTSGNAVTFKLSAPTAVVSGLDAQGKNIIGSTVASVDGVDFAVQSTVYTNAEVVYIDADGVVYTDKPTTWSAGKWYVAADLSNSPELYAEGVVIGQKYEFTIAKTDAAISAAKDTVNIGNNIVINVNVPGKPYVHVYYDEDYVLPVENQAGVDTEESNLYANVTLGIDGTASVAFEANVDGKTSFQLKELSGKPKVDVTIKVGEITAVADDEFFYLGNAIKLSGTTTAGNNLYFYIEGTNFNFQSLEGAYELSDFEAANGEWTIKIDSNDIKTAVSDQYKGLVAGTYTIIVSTVPYTEVAAADDMKAKAMSKVYGTAAVTMKQPFITDVKAAAVAIQDSKYDITGTAIAAENVNVYIFGTSFFLAKQLVTVDSDDETFKVTLDEATTLKMAPGTYFYLIQHPMNDKVFNVWNGSVDNEEKYAGSSEGKEADFFYAATGAGIETFVFNAYDRGTNYAAQALLDEISGQNIDDIFVQGTFEVAAQKLTINPIPAEVAQGTALTVSGTSNSGEGVEVIVNVLAGTFGATVKGDENAATFLTAKAVTKEDGTFEAAIDTSKLALGNYIVTVELDGTMYDSAAVEIVEKAPVTPPADDKPDTPVTPPADDKPTAEIRYG